MKASSSVIVRPSPALFLGLIMILAAAGCAGGTVDQQHAESKKAATERWLGMRTGLMLDMAQRQFDAGDMDQAEKSVTDALGVDDKNAKLYVLAARIHLQHNQLERAFHMLDQAIALDPKLPTAYFHQAVVLERWQEYEHALELYRQAYELLPDNADYLLSMAGVLVTLDRVDDALALLKEKLTYFDQNAALRAAIAAMHMIKNEPAQAAKYYQEAVRLKPGDTTLVEDLARAQMAAGRFEEAVTNLEKLSADPTVDKADLQPVLGEAYVGARRFSEARAIYLKMAQAEPKNVEHWLSLAQVAWRMEDLETTFVAASRAMAAAPRRADGYLYSGMVLQKRGKVEEALRFFDQAASLSPDSGLPLILRGLTLEQAGRKTQAAQAYNDALRRQPEDTRARQLLAQLEVKP